MVYDYIEGRVLFKYPPHLAAHYATTSPNDEVTTCLMRPLTWECRDPLYLTDESKQDETITATQKYLGLPVLVLDYFL